MSKPTDQATLTTRAFLTLSHDPLSLDDPSPRTTREFHFRPVLTRANQRAPPRLTLRAQPTLKTPDARHTEDAC